MMLAVLPVSLFATSAVAAGESPTRVIYVDGSTTSNVFVDGTATNGVAPSTGFDTALASGDHTILACSNTSTAVTSGAKCDPGAVTPLVGSLNNVTLPNSNSNYTVVLDHVYGANSTYVFENDLSQTGLGEARFTLNNTAGAPLYVCIGNDELFPSGVAQGDSGIADVTAQQGAQLHVGAAPGCGPSPSSVNLVAGTNFVLTTTNAGGPGSGTPACTTSCGQVLFVGEGTVPNNPDTVAFCATILDGPASLSGFGPALKTLVGNIDPTTTETIKNTQPSVGDQKAFVTTYTDVINAGDASVPAAIKDSWVTLTAGARKLLQTIQLVGYDMSKLPPSAVKDIVLGANGIKLPGVPPDEDVVAATADLTAFVTGTCLASSTPGETPAAPPAATPVAAAARFTG
jgi:hypothetical protein